MKYDCDFFYIVDGHSLLYRSYYAPMAYLTTRCPECGGNGPDKGQPDKVAACKWCRGSGVEATKATFAFCKTLMKLCREMKPAYLAVAMDAPRKTLWRRTIDPQYKNKRKGMPADLVQQKVRVKQILTAMGVPMVKVEGWEADDVIGTLARRFVSDEVGVRIVSGDRDLWQLLDDSRIEIYDPLTAEVIGKKDVLPNYGVTADNVVAFKAIAGDTGDNVPGIPGVGEKTAKALLKQYGSLAGVVRARKSIPGAMGRRICQAHHDGTLDRCRQLVTLKCDLDLDVDPSVLEFDGLRWDKARPIFRMLNFKRWEDNGK